MSNDENREEWKKAFESRYRIDGNPDITDYELQAWIAACEYQQKKIDELLKLFDGEPTHWSNIIYDKNKEIDKLEKENEIFKEVLESWFGKKSLNVEEIMAVNESKRFLLQLEEKYGKLESGDE